MQSRMDKYNNPTPGARSRTERNKELYEDVRNSSLKDFDVNSNVSVIDDNASIIDVGHVRQILSDRYNDDAPKRRSIELPTYEETPEEDTLTDTKEYDINAFLEKSKQGKNVDYNKERLRKIRDAQYDILNNLDLELKKIEENDYESKKNKEAEDNLMDLINTITHIEAINKEKYSKEVSGAMDLLGLGGEEETATDDKKEEIKDEIKKEVKEELKQEENEEDNEDNVEKTLSKLDIDVNSYDDFKDISKGDTATVIIKILIFIVLFLLIVGGIYILNNILDLGLF